MIEEEEQQRKWGGFSGNGVAFYVFLQVNQQQNPTSSRPLKKNKTQRKKKPHKTTQNQEDKTFLLAESLLQGRICPLGC